MKPDFRPVSLLAGANEDEEPSAKNGVSIAIEESSVSPCFVRERQIHGPWRRVK
jgi:hypothetical protein